MGMMLDWSKLVYICIKEVSLFSVNLKYDICRLSYSRFLLCLEVGIRKQVAICIQFSPRYLENVNLQVISEMLLYMSVYVVSLLFIPTRKY